MNHVFLYIIAGYTIIMLFVFCSYVFSISLLPKSKKTDFYYDETQDNTVIYLMIPCLNEEAVIESTLKSLLKSAPENLRIYVIDDASTDNTAEIVKGFKDKRVHLFRRKKPDAQTGKGNALNACYCHIAEKLNTTNLNPNEVLIGVFDADAHIADDHYTIIKKYFHDPEVGAVQSRIKMAETKNLLQKMQNYEFQVEITAIQNSREYMDSVCLGGNGQYMRFSTLRSLDGSPWGTCLLEDFEIGLKVLLKGWGTKFAIETEVEQQALKSYRYFIKQRSRWVQGNIQSLAYCKDIFKSKVSKVTKLDLCYFLSQSWNGLIGIFLSIFYAAMLIMAVHVVFFAGNPLTASQSQSIILLITIIALNYLPSFILYLWKCSYMNRRGEWKQDLICLLFNPVYRVMMYPAILLAFKRQFLGQKGWIKTKRNV